MYEIKKTEIFDIWLKNLRDFNGKGRILARIKT
jgi:putative component of toxin-antitoxin plasmid stabilization module